MNDRLILLNENTRFRPDESGACRMRNRCSFTSRDMAVDWPEAFTYAIVLGWDPDPDDDMEDDHIMRDLAAKYGWDEPLIEFLRDAHRRFSELADR